MQADDPLATMCLKEPGLPERLTQASTVTFGVSSAAADGIRTWPPAPSKASAPPVLPVTRCTPPDSVPVRPAPEVSLAVRPPDSSNAQRPMRPVAAFEGTAATNTASAPTRTTTRRRILRPPEFVGIVTYRTTERERARSRGMGLKPAALGGVQHGLGAIEIGRASCRG